MHQSSASIIGIMSSTESEIGAFPRHSAIYSKNVPLSVYAANHEAEIVPEIESLQVNEHLIWQALRAMQVGGHTQINFQPHLPLPRGIRRQRRLGQDGKPYQAQFLEIDPELGGDSVDFKIKSAKSLEEAQASIANELDESVRELLLEIGSEYFLRNMPSTLFKETVNAVITIGGTLAFLLLLDSSQGPDYEPTQLDQQLRSIFAVVYYFALSYLNSAFDTLNEERALPRNKLKAIAKTIKSALKPSNNLRTKIIENMTVVPYIQTFYNQLSTLRRLKNATHLRFISPPSKR